MPEAGTSFTRSRAVRVASGLASFGVVVGFSLVAASPASAATDADCTPLNTVDATTGTSTDIQTLLTASTPVICLSGTFTLTTGLTYDYDVTLHGLPSATLDGDGSYGILLDTSFGNTLTVENLRLTNGSAFDGGAINGYVVVSTNSTFDNNDAVYGGAIYAYGVSATDSVFEDNTAATGGAIVSAFTSVGDSTFTNNTAEDSGGAIYSYGSLFADSSTFEGNSAFFVGGAIASYGSLDVANSTFVENSTDPTDGLVGAVYTEGGTITQSTFLDNTAGPGAGQSVGNNGSTLTLRGNIFAGADATEAHLYGDPADFVDNAGNLFTTSAATEASLTSPAPSTQFDLTTLALFNGATLADNGGPTHTVALWSGSPAINAVPADPGSLTVDQRGVARPDVSDAGAYEFVAPVLAATGSVPSGILGGAAALLLGAGALAVGLARRAVRTR